MENEIDVKAVLADPCVHFWVKDVLLAGLKLDPLDFQRDAGLVAAIARQECVKAFGEVQSPASGRQS